VIAETYFSGVKRKFLGFRVLSGADIAHDILNDISAEYAETPFAAYALKTNADYLFANGKHNLAVDEYARLLKDYPNSQYQQYALRRSAEAELANFAGVEYDDTALRRAEERYRDYLAQYGAIAQREGVDLIIENIRERRAEKLFVIGEYYERTNHLSSAVHSYRIVAATWPNTVAAGKAASRLDILGPAGPVTGSAG
jgi:outer membrane protein assembly factor BamD (BamD/ComL family)